MRQKKTKKNKTKQKTNTASNRNFKEGGFLKAVLEHHYNLARGCQDEGNRVNEPDVKEKGPVRVVEFRLQFWVHTFV